MQDSTKLEVEGGELLIKSSKGIMAVIPKDRVDYVKDLIERKNFAAVDKYVQGLAVLKKQGDKAQDGGIIQDPPKDWNKFQQFNSSLPTNLRDDSFQYGDKNKYDLYGMWQSSGKPESFDQVKDTELFPKQEDGTYHGFSVGDDGVWLKPKNHPTSFMEYSSTQLDPSMTHMRVIQREDGRLQYVPKTPFLDVVASYKKSMESPTYKQRLARELYGDAPADMGEVEKNLQKRIELLKTLKTQKSGTYDVGEYFPETHSIVINPQEARKYGDEETILAHETSHALDTERMDAFTGKESAFTKKKKEILGEPHREFYFENKNKFASIKNEGVKEAVNKIISDVKSGKLKVTDKQAFDESLQDENVYGVEPNKLLDGILSATNADEGYAKELNVSSGAKKIQQEEDFQRQADFKDYLMRDSEVKAKINALRIKANLQHGYNFDEPFDISKYPTLKGDINYQQLNKELKIPDEAINKLSEYIAYQPNKEQGGATAKNGIMIPLAKFNASIKKTK